MEIKVAYLSENKFSRPGKKLCRTLGVVMHWTANPTLDAMGTRDYFDGLKDGHNGYASAHYIVGQDGDVVQCIPENEMAYHCGTNIPDPKSGFVYTDEARMAFGLYAEKYETLSPNMCTIGIEMCPVDYNGLFSPRTLERAAELCADVLLRHNLSVNQIHTHYGIVGWKRCPLLWVKKPLLFYNFCATVAEYISKSKMR